MSGWSYRILGDCAEIISGQSPPGASYNERGEGLPFFQGKAEFGDIHPTAHKYCTAPKKVSEPGDILISVRAPVGPTNIAAERCCIGRGLAAIRPNPEIADRDFILFYLRYFEPRWSAKSQGSTFPAINRKELTELPINIPPLPEQRRIVDILNHANGVRRLRREAREKVRQLIPALFVEMFGDPVSNPKGWPTELLYNLVKFVSGATPSKKKSAYWGGSVPWVSPKDMKAGEIEASLDQVTGQALSETNLKLIPPQSVLIVVRGLILRHTVPIRLNTVPVTINQDLKAMIPAASLWPLYLRWTLQMMHNDLLNKVSTAAHGTKKLDMDRLENLHIPTPHPDLQKAFAERVADIQALIAQQDRMAETSEELIASLMGQAFDGAA